MHFFIIFGLSNKYSLQLRDNRPHNRRWIKIGDGNGEGVKLFPNTFRLLAKFQKGVAKVSVKVTVRFDDPVLFTIPFMFDPVTTSCQVGKLCWHRIATGNNKNKRTLSPTCCNGFMADLTKLFEEDLNIDFKLYEVEDGSFGSKATGAWNGMIGEVHRGIADAAFTPLIMSQKRSEAVKFTAPLFASNTVLVTMAYHEQPPLWNLLAYRPLSLSLWLSTFVLIFTASVLLVYTEKLTGRNHNYSWKSSITYLMGLLLQRDIGGDDPRHHASRTVAVVIAIATMVVMTTYTAVLTVETIENKEHHSITGFDDSKVRFCFLVCY